MARSYKVSGTMELDTRTFETKITEVSKKFGNFCRNSQKDLKSLGKSWTTFGKDLLLLGGTATIGLYAAFKNLVKSNHEIIQLSKMLDISADSMKKFKFAADLSGMSVEEIGTNASKMMKAIGSGKADKTLERIGINPETIKKLSADNAFGLILDKLALVKNSFERTADATEIFGRGGFTMLKFIKDGKSEFSEFIAEANKLGISFGPEKVKMFEDFNHKIVMMNTSSKMLGNTILTDLGPSIIAGYEQLLKFTSGANDFIKNNKEFVSFFFKAAFYCGSFSAAIGTLGMVFGRAWFVMSGFFGMLKNIIKWMIGFIGAKVAETKVIKENTEALGLNTLAKQINAEAGMGTMMAGSASAEALAAAGGTVAGVGAGVITAGILAGTLGGAAAGYGMYKAGWSRQGTIPGYLLGGIGRTASDWIVGDNGTKGQGQITDRTKDMIASGKINADGTSIDPANKRLMESQNRTLNSIDNSLKTIANGKSIGASKMLVPAF